jgi:uncharacterized protein YegJ (DUF2314 family)
MDINFIDAQEMHKRNPKTFEVPTPDEIKNLKQGDLVKVCENNERFWVTIIKLEDEKIVGRIDNDLVFRHEFGYGDTINFEKRHIYSIYSIYS